MKIAYKFLQVVAVAKHWRHMHLRMSACVRNERQLQVTHANRLGILLAPKDATRLVVAHHRSVTEVGEDGAHNLLEFWKLKRACPFNRLRHAMPEWRA